MNFDEIVNSRKDPRDSRSYKYACTVVNLLPFELREDKPHMLPSCFVVPAAEGESFGILHVEEGIHYVPNPLIDEGKPGASIKQTTLPNEMARSVVEDFAFAQVCLGESAKPGLFWVNNRLTAGQIRAEYSDLLKEYQQYQINWFRSLCAMADADWNKNHNMLAVSDLQRIAARALGVKEPWVEMQVTETANCPMCQILINPNAIVCSACKFILKPDLYKKEAFANV